MCGIAGVIYNDIGINHTEKTNVNKMLDFLVHRGPDYSGMYEGNNYIFGSTRLSVMDLSHNGDMPFIYNNGEFVLSYNGEITNFLELKEKFNLENKYKFKSKSDTEVLLYLYIELGIDKLLSEIDGYFAFAIYDKKNKKSYIVRDFYGTRPLFYLSYNNNLYFASEIKGLLQIKGFKKVLNKEAIFHFFGLGYIPGELTPFKGIKELDGGHYLEYDFDIKKYKLREYYKISSKINSKRNFKETKDELYDMFKDSVKRNFNSNAEIGSTLSGGIDTSVIVGMLKELGYSKKLHTFAIKINESSFDESPYQKIMSEYADTIHHTININPSDIRDNIHKYISFTDEPYADGSAIPTFLLGKEAKKYVKVLLSGEGGDELFSAYETHQAFLYMKFYNKYIPLFIRNFIYKLVHLLPVNLRKISFDFKAKRFTEGSNSNIPESHYYWKHILSHTKQISLLGNEFKKTSSFFSTLYNKLNFKEGLSKIAYIDMKLFLIGDLMVKNDRMLMANSLEARFPFLERKITNFAFTMPEKFKVNLFKRRIIEKEALRDTIPKVIYDRPNFGMEIPYSKWLIEDLNDLSKKYFTREKIENTGVLNYETAKDLIDEHFQKKADNGRFLWSLLNFLIWFELFIETDNYKKYVKEKL